MPAIKIGELYNFTSTNHNKIFGICCKFGLKKFPHETSKAFCHCCELSVRLFRLVGHLYVRQQGMKSIVKWGLHHGSGFFILREWLKQYA